MEKTKLKGYIPTIGIECHVQLKTKTKLFAAVDVADFEAKPNTHISQICLGMPGALPVLNIKAVELAARAAVTLNTTPQAFSKFDRKHYFYPDLPKGYQISQFEEPIILGGFVDIKVSGKPKRVNITRAHLEEDAGKTLHPSGADYSLVDLNRAGTPLLEIVSEPDMHSAEEARAFAHELYLLMRYAEISEADLYQGNMRFDVNVSVSKGTTELGIRTETKNLNSFRSVEKAVEYEVKRQIELLEKDTRIVQETRGWDDTRQKTFSQRSKEDAHDYRYFPDPDIPPLDLSQNFMDDAVKNMPKLPGEIRIKLKELNLDDSTVETLVEEIKAGKFTLNILDNHGAKIAKRVANWLTTDVQAMIAEGNLTWDTVKLDELSFVNLAELTLQAKISSTNAKIILDEIVTIGGKPSEIAETKKLLQLSDETGLNEIVKKVMSENPQAVQDFKDGQEKAIGFLVGQVMKLSKGQANPGISQKLIRENIK